MHNGSKEVVVMIEVYADHTAIPLEMIYDVRLRIMFLLRRFCVNVLQFRDTVTKEIRD